MIVNKENKENNVNPIHSHDIEISNNEKNEEDNLINDNDSHFQDTEYYQRRK